MSDFVRLLNLIKTRRDLTWLTPSQQAAFEELRRQLQVPGSVNLFGPVGVGKTFLVWALADELGYSYLPHVSHLDQVQGLAREGVIVDNCQTGRRAHRDLLRELSYRNVQHAVFVTRQLTHDYTYYVELKLTLEDQAKVQRNLVVLGYFRDFTEALNLWRLLNPCL